MGYGLDSRGADYRSDSSEHTINAAEGRTEEQMSEVQDIVEKAARSYDPEMQKKALAFRAWQEAGIELAKAQDALAAEQSRWNGRRTDLEIEIAAQNAGAVPIIKREREAIEKSEKLIAEAQGRVDAARAVFDEEMAEY